MRLLSFSFFFFFVKSYYMLMHTYMFIIQAWTWIQVFGDIGARFWAA